MALSKSITKTAEDAIQAKWSAISSGYEPIGERSHVYKHFLEQVMRNIQQGKQQGGDVVQLPRRQSPLVNAGYAMRVASIASAIQSFVSFHLDHHQNRRIRVILLGCGLDVIGLWSAMLRQGQIDVVEVDTSEVCQAKRKILVEESLVIPDNAVTGEDGMLLQGRVHFQHEDGQTSAEKSNYKLFSADLRHVDTFPHTLIVEAGESPIPTLVLSELVLAYLGVDNTNRLLDWCSTYLTNTQAPSAMVAFEPVGVDLEQSEKNQQGQENQAVSPSPVVLAYQVEYAYQFQAKLSRGHATISSDSKSQKEVFFHNLGRDCPEIEHRFRSVGGFQSAHCCLAGTSAHWARKQSKRLQLQVSEGELFDEHAALALHLASYVLICAFPFADAKDLRNEREQTFLLKRRMCPWAFPWPDFYACLSLQQPSTMSSNRLVDEPLHLTRVECRDEPLIREYFVKTYEHLFPSYPAVNKMVKTALKKDLAPTGSMDDDDDDIIQRLTIKSAIGARYQAWGGDFLVMVQYLSGIRTVVGAIGIRRLSEEETNKRTSKLNFGHATVLYEVHRLFVSQAMRTRGIGRRLLQAAELFCQKRTPSCGLIATTPSILVEANQFYVKNGFTVKDSNQVGGLTMNEFFKQIVSA